MIKVVSSFLLIVLAFTLVVSNADAATRVKGYTRKSGKYVAPHYKSTSNRTKFDNYSTKGNINPYTGKKGTVNPYKINYR